MAVNRGASLHCSSYTWLINPKIVKFGLRDQRHVFILYGLLFLHPYFLCPCFPVSLGFADTSLWTKLFDAAGLWISLRRTLVWDPAAVQKVLTLCAFWSASSQYLSPLHWQRAAVANISWVMESANINKQPASSTTQKFHRGPLSIKERFCEIGWKHWRKGSDKGGSGCQSDMTAICGLKRCERSSGQFELSSPLNTLSMPCSATAKLCERSFYSFSVHIIPSHHV